MKKMVFGAAVAAAVMAGLSGAAVAKDSYRFVIVPKVVHPWFDLVNDGAMEAAAYLKETAGVDVEVEYLAPQTASVVEQNQILERAIATRPDGIAIDLLDASANKPVLEEAQQAGVKLAAFDSVPPDGMVFTAIGNDFCEQAKLASERLVELLGGKGKVAIMQGVPTAPNHNIRYECHKEVFASYPDIELVAEGIDNDDIETAQKQAATIMQSNPDLGGWVACDAAGPIGIGQAIKEAGLEGKVQMVGLDNLPDMITLVEEGVADSSSSTRPQIQGFYSVMMLYDGANGIVTPKTVDTGILLISKDNLEGELR
ncbi:substrate-binding domain-containing protein [Tropicimonas isoalkanivorans]|uniref:Monosaccharide ABC transporter substrate-binding protein, CUT2 family (TC 3.A.1.2.-) n=1 Tax=Tropicimonas isoalkanivorans TaxID=441112 RepID=A0A1I1DST2_9RHOB|nr:substrate-binding domain-containing protein [Tropicimonas isoalkanivorans]SFB77877.1 monosaccharide ABC transporter substrate-binding protein, CUT2 family (TC 3.A.1.2.-) [Tropicimonas isoalkanivorans]